MTHGQTWIVAWSSTLPGFAYIPTDRGIVYKAEDPSQEGHSASETRLVYSRVSPVTQHSTNVCDS